MTTSKNNIEIHTYIACTSCGETVRPSYAVCLSDTKIICAKCAAKAIKDLVEALSICRGVVLRIDFAIIDVNEALDVIGELSDSAAKAEPALVKAASALAKWEEKQ